MVLAGLFSEGECRRYSSVEPLRLRHDNLWLCRDGEVSLIRKVVGCLW